MDEWTDVVDMIVDARKSLNTVRRWTTSARPLADAMRATPGGLPPGVAGALRRAYAALDRSDGGDTGAGDEAIAELAITAELLSQKEDLSAEIRRIVHRDSKLLLAVRELSFFLEVWAAAHVSEPPPDET